MPVSRASPAQLREMVCKAYSAAAEQPQEKHACPVGRQFAESIGYPPELLVRLPSVSCDAFAGVSNVSLSADLPAGATVLDLGCGAGLDTLIAAQRVGRAGKVISVDFSEAMLARAQDAVVESGTTNVDFLHADAGELPIRDGEIDVVLVNGIFNLNPARDAIFHELARVVRRSGAVYAAELILSQPALSETRASEQDWFA
jgi:arsenite methyltransferase